VGVRGSRAELGIKRAQVQNEVSNTAETREVGEKERAAQERPRDAVVGVEYRLTTASKRLLAVTSSSK
ncbi:unnamed protein product, partial [Closterium sp. Naga37s-1]